MRIPKYLLNKLAKGGYDTVPEINRDFNQAPDLSGMQQSPGMQVNPRVPQAPLIQRQDIVDGFNIFNVGMRGISEAHARGQQQDYVQTNTANPLANLAFDDGRSRDVKYGYEQFAEGGQTAPSLYDYLDKTGRDDAKGFNSSRKALATQLGIKNYSGTAEQNTQLLGILQQADSRGVSPQTLLSRGNKAPAPVARPQQAAPAAPVQMHPPYPQHPMFSPANDRNAAESTAYSMHPPTRQSAPQQQAPAQPENSIADYVGMGMNYIKRTYNKIMGDDETAVSRLPMQAKQQHQQYVPPIVTGDTIPDNNRVYHVPEVIDLTRIKAGMRDRGDRNEVQSDGLVFSAFDKTRSTTKANKDFDPEAVYVGINPDGSVRAGHGKEFGDDAHLLRFNMAENIRGFSKKADGQYETTDASAAAKGHVFPLLRRTDNSTTGINLLMKDGVKGNENLYGNITGGRALFTSPDMKKQIVVSGSAKTVDDQLEKFKKDNQLDHVNYIMLDNGSFSRGYRTKDGHINANDWKDFDRRNVSGGSGVYLQGRGYKQGGEIQFGAGGEKLKINDPRTLSSWGEPLKKPRTGEYDKDVIKNIALAAQRQGNDPYTAIAVGMQESGLGTYTTENAQNNWGQVRHDKWDNDPQYQETLKKNPDLNPEAVAMNYVLKHYMSDPAQADEAHKIQGYNGYRLKANNDIGATKMYGIDLTKYPQGYDLQKDPRYGNAVLDLRENVVKKNPELVDYVNNLTSDKSKRISFVQGKDGYTAQLDGKPYGNQNFKDFASARDYMKANMDKFGEGGKTGARKINPQDIGAATSDMRSFLRGPEQSAQQDQVVAAQHQAEEIAKRKYIQADKAPVDYERRNRLNKQNAEAQGLTADDQGRVSTLFNPNSKGYNLLHNAGDVLSNTAEVALALDGIGMGSMAKGVAEKGSAEALPSVTKPKELLDWFLGRRTPPPSGQKWLDEWMNDPITAKKISDRAGIKPEMPGFIPDESSAAMQKRFEDYQIKRAAARPTYVRTDVKDVPIRNYDDLKNHNPDIHAAYNTTSGGVSLGDGNIFIDDKMYKHYPREKEKAIVHELTHRAEFNDAAFTQKEREELSAPFGKDGTQNWDGNLKEYNDTYFTNPTEIHARMNEARYDLGLKPSDEFTEAHYNKVMKDNKFSGMGPYIKNKPSFIKLMNNFWAVPPAIGAGAALSKKQKGGNIFAHGGSAYRNKILQFLYADDKPASSTKEAVTQNTAPTEEEVPQMAPQAPQDNGQDELMGSIISGSNDMGYTFNPYKHARGVFTSSNSANTSEKPGFKSFGSYEEGKNALISQLKLYQTGQTKNPVTPDSTLYDAMAVYAPASDGNDPRHYAEFVAKQMGINPNSKIRGIDVNKWADAVEKMEGNKGNNPGNIRN